MISAVDEVIFFNDMQYTPRDWRNRNQIKTSSSFQWLSVLVKVKDKYHQTTRETELDATTWREAYWKTLEQNYRHASQNNTLAFLEASHSELKPSQSIAHYFGIIQNSVAQSDFNPNTPMINLSGKSPGILYVLGATSIGQAWMIGGYPGSDQFVIASLSRLTFKEFVTALLFIDPKSTRKISTEILENFGITAAKDYCIAVEFTAPEKKGKQVISHKQQLLRPTRSIQDASATCKKTRIKHQ